MGQSMLKTILDLIQLVVDIVCIYACTVGIFGEHIEGRLLAALVMLLIMSAVSAIRVSIALVIDFKIED